MTMLLLACSAVTALALQEPPQTPPPDAETIELRLYLIHRDRAPFDFRNGAAFVALRSEKGGGRTIPMEIVMPKEDAKEPGKGQIRQLDGTPLFAELKVSPGVRASTKGLPSKVSAVDLTVDELVKRSVALPPPRGPGRVPAPADEQKPEANGHEDPEKAEKPVEEKTAPPSMDEWIEEVHAGPYFRAVVPAGDLPAAFDASVTVRSGDQSWTARGYRHPAEEPLTEVIRNVDDDLKAILRHTEALEFGRIPIVTVRIRERLARLSGLSLRDRDLEYSRAWLYRLLDQMDQATRTGEEAIQTLVGTFYAKMDPLRRAAEADPKQTTAPDKEPAVEAR